MANETYTLIQKTTLNASAASITLSNIPQTFTDLVVKLSVRGTQAGVNQTYTVSFNGSSSNFTAKRLYGSGAAAASDTNITLEGAGSTATASTFSNQEVYIPNYTSTTNAKSFSVDDVSENNATTAYALLTAGLWNPGTQAAITSITFTAVSASFVQYSSVSLYGVAKEGVTPVAGPKASGGDIITNDGTYWIHQFLNSGTFTPSSTLSCDYLVVAGGGGGGSGSTGYGGGGGGAGGLRSTVTATGGGGTLESALSVTAQSYAITVGAGGTGGTNAAGTAGSNSTFSTITSTGGGQGAGVTGTVAGGTGGSGGGSFYTQNGGAGTANQGFAGGKETVANGNAGGGGGGAGAVGSNATASQVAGAGGAGVSTSISSTSTAYSGGGGGGAPATGGAGGTGGGGTGGTNAAGTSGTTNRGGGGGGGSNSSAPVAGGAGGSGIVIIRYAI